MLARAAFPAFFFTLAGFILLLLVTLSVPIIKTIYLLHIEFPGGAAAANVGVFGTCYQGGTSTFLGIHYTGTAQCTDPKVGYTIDPTFFGENFGSRGQRVVVKALAGALILNPIAAGLAGISLVFAFFAWFCASRIMEIFLFITLFLSSLAAWIAFWLDVALVLIARHRVNDYTNGTFSAHIGNAFWLALAGALSLTAAICLAGCGSFGRYSERYVARDGAPLATSGEKPYRRHFWQRNTVNRGTY